ncbi:alcohol dehydrogenase [Catenibacillus scindens]|uniref:Alcohol dehydrogenase n=2 Tax=Catenibacillus scindens TaxID=673271 RepID=A0A7W8H9V2_9FIRM|nr:alcohol dehydrogenase [Catenibacillus scindens]
MAGTETVLLYNFNDPQKLRNMKMVFLKMGIRMRTVTPDMYMEPVGALARLKGYELSHIPYEGSGFDDEMMVMNGFSSARLDELLRQLRRNKVPKIPLKAVVTAHNAAWTSLELHSELTKEHQMMTHGPIMDAVIYKGNGTFALEKRKIPTIQQPTDAIVKVTLTSICTSDLHIKHGHVPKAVPGIVVGHEIVGEIVQLGNCVSGLSVGDRVAVNVETFCGECFFCQRGFVNNCTNENGGWALGCRIDGGQAQYVRVPLAQNGLTKIPDSVTDEQAIFTGDILSTGYWGAKISEIKPDDIIVVIGAGPTGICAMKCAALYHPAHIIAVDIDQRRLDLIKNEHIADVTINSQSQSVKQAILEITDGRGADVVIEAAGGKNTFQMAWEIARPNAIVTVIALYDEDQVLPLPQMYGKNLTFKTGGVDACNCREILDLIADGRLDTTCLITHRFDLKDAMAAYDLFESHRDGVMKVVLKP